MPPEAHEELQAHADAGRVEILQDTEVPLLFFQTPLPMTLLSALRHYLCVPCAERIRGHSRRCQRRLGTGQTKVGTG